MHSWTRTILLGWKGASDAACQMKSPAISLLARIRRPDHMDSYLRHVNLVMPQREVVGSEECSMRLLTLRWETIQEPAQHYEGFSDINTFPHLQTLSAYCYLFEFRPTHHTIRYQHFFQDLVDRYLVTPASIDHHSQPLGHQHVSQDSSTPQMYPHNLCNLPLPRRSAPQFHLSDLQPK